MPMTSLISSKLDLALRRRHADFSSELAFLASNLGNGKRPTSSGSRGSSPSHIPQFGSYLERPSALYFVPIKQSRVNFPEFDGSDFPGWAYCCISSLELMVTLSTNAFVS